MRVFFAFELNNEDKEYIHIIQNKMKATVNSGNFTEKNNFHITLRFIGEINEEKIGSLLEVLDDIAANAKPLVFNLNKIGMFDKKGKKTIWMGSESNEVLNDIYIDIEKLITDKNFDKEDKVFLPHITLVRSARIKDCKDIELIDIHKEIKISSISLMESKRVEGVLRYIPIANRKLIGKEDSCFE